MTIVACEDGSTSAIVRGRAYAETMMLCPAAPGGTEGSVSQSLHLAIVAHCVDVDPQKVPDSSRNPEGGRFRTGRDHDRKPRVGVTDFLSRHSPQQLAV